MIWEAANNMIGMFSLPLFSATTWTLLVLCFTLLLLYSVWPYRFFKKLGIPGPMPFPFMGTIGYNFGKDGFVGFDKDCYRKYGNVWGTYEGRNPVLVVADPEMLKTILVKECYSAFTNRREFDQDMLGPMAEGLTTVKDEKWKRIRSTISPSFTSGRLRQVFPIIQQYADRLTETLGKSNLEESVGIKTFVAPYSLDVVTSASFGVDTNSINNPDDPLVSHVKTIVSGGGRLWLFFLMMILPFAKHIIRLLGVSLFPKDSVDYCYNIMKRFKGEHHTDNSSRDFLQLMIQNEISETTLKNDQPSKGLTEPEILSQSFIFILGGYETTSATLSFILYNLATNPDVLRTLQEEIDSSFPKDAPVSYEGVVDLQYMDQVINESMRLMPTAPRLERMCKATVQVNGFTIPENTMVAIPLFVLHKDPQYWNDPELFQPERFSKDNKHSINPYVYMPFGVGPRNCVGMRFAVLTMKMVLISLLQTYSVETCKDTIVPLEFSPMYQPVKPIQLKFVPRSGN